MIWIELLVRAYNIFILFFALYKYFLAGKLTRKLALSCRKQMGHYAKGFDRAVKMKSHCHASLT